MLTRSDINAFILLIYWGPMFLLMAGGLIGVCFAKVKWSVRVLLMAVVLLGTPVPFVLPLWKSIQKDKAEHAAYQARYQPAYALFKKLCADAGDKIYRTAENVEGVRLLKVIDKKSWDVTVESGNPGSIMWEYAAILGARIGKTDPGDPERYIKTFMEYNDEAHLHNRGAPTRGSHYDYVDVLQPDGSIVRYSGGPFANVPGQEHPPTLRKHPRPPKHPARYGVTFENNVDPALRRQGIAGTTIRVIDLKTNELMGERTTYVFDSSFGNAPYDNGWLRAERCTDKHAEKTRQHKIRYFVERVLKPKSQD